MPGVQDLPLPDDSGSDAFERYRYQAHVAFPFCLACWAGQGVTAVYCELFEDLLVESDEQLRFLAIKTRNPEYGPWRLTDLTGASGALRSLLRTHRSLADLEDDREIIYEARLEGALRRDDDIRELAPPRAQAASPGLISRCAKLLDSNDEEMAVFLAPVRVVANEPPREVIQERNLKYLRELAGRMSADELKAVYDKVIALIELAMSAQLLGDEWPRAILVPITQNDVFAALADAKRLDADRLDPALSPLSGIDAPLLTGDVDPSLLHATSLGRKLVGAGANDKILQTAKELRARAGRRIEEVRAARLTPPDDQLDDLNARVLAMAQAVEVNTPGDSPANAIWLEVMDRLRGAPGSFDTAGILAQDPMLLVGQLCQLSDECRFEWGVAEA